MKALISSVSLSVLILICFWHCRLATASLLIPQKDEGKAHVCVMAWSIKGNVKDIFLPSPDAQV